MSEKEGQGIDVKELSSTSFGYVIGFLLPGLLGLYALAYWFPDIRSLLEPAASKDATIGPSFLLLLSALTVGLLTSAMRFFVFEKWLCKEHSFQKDMFKELAKEQKLPAFKAVVDEHYRYHQFYGGCAIAFIVLFPKWLWGNWHFFHCPVRFILIAIFALFEWLLVVTAKDAFIRYV